MGRRVQEDSFHFLPTEGRSTTRSSVGAKRGQQLSPGCLELRTGDIDMHSLLVFLFAFHAEQPLGCYALVTRTVAALRLLRTRYLILEP